MGPLNRNRTGRARPRPDHKRGRGRDGADAGPQDLGVAALGAVLQLSAPADLELRRFFSMHPQMGRRDRGQVAELVFDVLRNRRLYAYLAQSGSGSLPARLAHLSRERQRIQADSLPLEVRASLPDWLYRRLAQRLDPASLESLAFALLEPAALDLRVNVLKAEPAAVLESLRADRIDCEPLPGMPLALRVRGKPALEKTRAFTAGECEVQDSGSQLIAALVAPRRGQTVVDFCAGAGGKTLALAAALRGSGQVFACDVSASRLQRLRPRLARSGATNVQPFGIDNEHDGKLARMAGRADAVLVDAPCSGSGTVRRNPDLKWRVDEAAIAALVQQQRSILASAARLVKPGGTLVYATCSLLDEENDAIRRDFESKHPGWQVEPAGPVLERQGITLPAPLTSDCLELRPDVHGCDAFYAVRWRAPSA